MRQKHLFEHSHILFPAKARRSFLRFAAVSLLLVPFATTWNARAQSATPTRTTLAAATVDTGTRTGATLTATVQTTTGTPVTAGTVDFLLPNGESLGSSLIKENGTATLLVAQLPAGSTTAVSGTKQVNITAAYNASAADNDFAASASVATPLATPAPTTQLPDFTVTGNPTTVTATQGAYGTTAITVTSVGGYTGAIEFSCSNLPARVTCAFNPTQQTLAADGTFVSTLELQTQAPSGTASSSLLRNGNVAMAFAFPGAFALLALSGRRRKGFRGLQMLGIAMLLAGAGAGLSGCSQRYSYLKHAPSIAGGTPTGTYPITVAVDGSQGSAVIEHDLTVSLVVN